MNLLNPDTSWQAQNLPAGLVLNDGIISGTPTAKGAFSVPVTVSNSLGSDTKNISILTKNRPGTEKFSILQDGQQVAQLTIPELQAMVQDGSAQTQFNCRNTQIVLPVLRPTLRYSDTNNAICSIDNDLVDTILNFADFRNVTLQDGSTRQGLILQFDKSLWKYYAPFDTGDNPLPDELDRSQPSQNISKIKRFNRWRYSTLRQWLNSDGINWFQPAYDGDALISYNNIIQAVSEQQQVQYHPTSLQQAISLWGACSSYADTDARGFLDLLPDDIHNILVPVRVVTQAFFDEDNTNSSIADPDDVDGVDADVTFDKVFIPSFREMDFTTISPQSLEQWQQDAEDCPEGAAWEFWCYKLASYAWIGYNNSYYDWLKQHKSEYPLTIKSPEDYDYISGFIYSENITELLNSWCASLSDDIANALFPYFLDGLAYTISQRYQGVITRSAHPSNTSQVRSVIHWTMDNIHDLRYSFDVPFALVAPAFVIC